jgi:hypothetical protein
MGKRIVLLLVVLSCFLTSKSQNEFYGALDLSPAKWIWYPSGRTLQNTFVLFRKKITLSEKPQNAIGWILADSRYRLLVNGKRVQWGPAPSDPRWPEADPINLTDFLTIGENVLAVEVCFYGSGDGTTPIGKPGLLLNLDIDGKEIITDHSWQCLLARSWRPGQYKRWFLRSLQEDFDARLYPYGWDTVGFIPNNRWLSAEEISSDGVKPSVYNSYYDYMWEVMGGNPDAEIRKRSVPLMDEFDVMNPELKESMWIEWKVPAEDFFDMAMGSDSYNVVKKEVCTYADNAYTIEPNEDNAASLIFAFKEQGVGWPFFTIDAPEGTIVELLVHEAHEVGGPAIINSHFNSWSRFVCKEGVNEFEVFDFESYKWVQLHIRNFSKPIKLSSIGMRRRVYPWKVVPKIVVNNDTIQKVLEASVNTLYNCAQETMVDGMARERQQYSGDGSHQLHPVFQTFGDDRLPYRFINTFSQGSSIDGYFMDSWPGWDRLARSFERQMQLTGWGPILDHSIGFCFDVYHYYMYTGNKNGLNEVFPRLVKFYEYLKSLTDYNEHLLPVDDIGLCSVYLDHTAYKQNRHKQLALNLYVAAMCKNALAPLCALYDRKDLEKDVLEYGEAIKQGCINKFWDVKRKVYINNLTWEKEEGEIRYCDRSLSTALIYDLCPDGETDESLRILIECPSGLGTSYPCNAVWPLWALVKYRKIDKVISDLKEKWGKMSSVWSNNTLQEMFVSYPDDTSQWSHCAMYPLIALNQGIAGIYPLEPGGKRMKIEPQLGSLDLVDFDVQTLNGSIHFHAEGKLGNRTLKLDIPKGISAELWLDERENLDLPFLRRESNGVKVYELGEGSKKIRLKYN